MPDTEFDWQIGGDELPSPGDGDPAVPEAAAPEAGVECPARSGNRSKRVTLIALAALVLAGALVVAVASRRYEEMTAPVKEDIVELFGTVQYAAGRRDVELYTSLLMPNSEYNWRASQQQLLATAQLFDRSPFGLSRQADPHIADIILSPEMTQAEVVVEQAYIVDDPFGITQTVRLRHSAVYQFDGRQWLIAWPDATYWGETLTTQGRFLKLSYPERDEAFGRRLAGDLDALLEKMCAGSTGIDCTGGFTMTLRLEKSLHYLADLMYPYRPAAYGPFASDEIILPAPTLIGLPVDETSYQALYRAYAERLLTAAIARAAQFTLFGSDNVIDWRVHLLLQAETRRQRVALGEQAWPAHSTNTDPLANLQPNQDILLHCFEGFREGGSLLRYSPPADAWSKVLSGGVYVSMLPLPTGEGVILQEMPSLADTSYSRVMLWQGGRARILLDRPAGSADLFPRLFSQDPSGLHLVMASLSAEAPQPFDLINLDRCTSAGCELIPLSGLPVWSPDGSRTIQALTTMVPREGWLPAGKLALGDAEGQSLTEVLSDAEAFELRDLFWLDGDTYGYVRYGTTSAGTETRLSVTLMSADIAGGEPRELLNAAALAAALPEEVRPQTPDFHFFAAINPGDPRFMSISAYAPQQPEVFDSPNRAFLFLYNVESNEIIAAVDLGIRFISSSDFSPDGRWLAIGIIDPVASTWAMHVYDMAGRRVWEKTFNNRVLPSFAAAQYQWSLDGKWLLELNEGILRLIAPGDHYERTVVPGSPGCFAAAWVNR